MFTLSLSKVVGDPEEKNICAANCWAFVCILSPNYIASELYQNRVLLVRHHYVIKEKKEAK